MSDDQVFQVFATAARGLGSALHQELVDLGLSPQDPETGGVRFQATFKEIMLCNLSLRTANRVLIQLGSFKAKEDRLIYDRVRSLPWTEFFDCSKTISVDASLSGCFQKDSRYVGLKVKDAVVDQFREKVGDRPSVERQHPDVRIVVTGYLDQYKLYLDTSGEPLFKRGYRTQVSASSAAPLKETLAAGMLKIAGYTGEQILVDPFCGSGTIVVEAALMAAKSAPGLMRESFGFEHLFPFVNSEWEALRERVEEAEIEAPPSPIRIYASDKQRAAIESARKNAQRAGVLDWISFTKKDVVNLTGQDVVKSSDSYEILFVTNPPYGVRLGGDSYELKDAYGDFGYTLKSQFPESTAWILAGNPELTGELKLKANQKVFLYNGKIETRFLSYKIGKLRQ